MTKAITITAGHSLVDPGAVAFGHTEAEIARDMRNMVKSYILRENITVHTDGENLDNKNLSEAIKLISKSGVAVEFHCNAFTKATAGGVEALAQSKDKVLSRALCKAVSDVLSIDIRGTEGGWKDEGSGQHSRLGYVRNGGIILELFFITNPTELDKWNAKKWLVAKAVAKVLTDHVKGV